MNENGGLYNEKGYRIRCMKGLIVQLREDHEELKRAWRRFHKRPRDISEMERVARALSWLRKNLDSFEDLRRRGIEGIAVGEVKGIEKDIEEKERDLRYILLSVSREVEYTHLG